MRIQHLYIENIASIERAEIDFENGPLSSDPIFLITGDTGTGKTTILNAICLALFDKVPALNTIGSADEDAEGLRTNNTRQFMRKGTGYSCVRLRFVGNDEKEYEASWTSQRARKKPTGAIQKSIYPRNLLDVGKNKLYTKKNDIDAEIQRVVGMSFEQFTRTTMLAQGQFATFMKATDDDKSDILEKLTGTEIYSVIGRKINELYRGKSAEVDVVQAKIDGARLLPDETKMEYAGEIERLASGITEMDSRLRRIDAGYSWLSQNQKFNRQLVEMESGMTEAAGEIESDENKARLSMVKLYDDTVEVRRLISEERNSQSHLDGLNTELGRESGETLPKVLDGISWLRKEQNGLQGIIAELSASLSAQGGDAEVYTNAQRVEEIAKVVQKSLQNRDKHRKNWDRLTKDADKSREGEKPLAESLAKAECELSAAQSAMDSRESAMKEYDMGAISEELTKTVNEIAAIQKAITSVDDYMKCKAEYVAASSRASKARDAMEATAKSLAETKALLPESEREKDRADAYYQGMKELKDHIASLRERFTKTHECPLCGNRDAHIHGDEVIADKLLSAQETAAATKRRYDELVKMESGLKAKFDMEKRDAEACGKDETLCADHLESAKERASQFAEDYESDGCRGNLEKQLSEAETRKDTISSRLKKGQECLNELDASRKVFEQRRAAKEAALSALDKQCQSTKSCIDNAARENELAEKFDKEAADSLADFNSYMRDSTATFENVASIAKDISERGAKYESDKRRLEESQRKVDELNRRIEDGVSATQRLVNRFLPVYEAGTIECGALENVIRKLNERINTLDGEIRGEEQKHARICRDIAAWFEAHDGIIREDVDEIAKKRVEDIERERETCKGIADRIVKLRHEIGVVKNQLESMEESRPEIEDGATVESLAELKMVTEVERNASTSRRIELETLLANDKRNKEKLVEECRRLDLLREERNNWKLLDDNFGSADGKKFKRVAQSYVLRALLSKANYYLDMLSRRYRLDCEDGSLTINVIDAHLGGAVRNVGLLSGGESFVVSLALALGLSAISKEKINVDTLFIDEGFGTLDKDILETVINTLDRLHNLGGRRIGIISHVQDLKDRIPTQIRVVRTGASTSQIEVTSNR